MKKIREVANVLISIVLLAFIANSLYHLSVYFLQTYHFI